jgi:hypothetical protein
VNQKSAAPTRATTTPLGADPGQRRVEQVGPVAGCAHPRVNHGRRTCSRPTEVLRGRRRGAVRDHAAMYSTACEH